MTEYKCGHSSKPVFLNNDIGSLFAYEDWRTSTGYDGDKSQCFNCYCRDLKRNIRKSKREKVKP